MFTKLERMSDYISGTTLLNFKQIYVLFYIHFSGEATAVWLWKPYKSEKYKLNFVNKINCLIYWIIWPAETWWFLPLRSLALFWRLFDKFTHIVEIEYVKMSPKKKRNLSLIARTSIIVRKNWWNRFPLRCF